MMLGINLILILVSSLNWIQSGYIGTLNQHRSLGLGQHEFYAGNVTIRISFYNIGFRIQASEKEFLDPKEKIILNPEPKPAKAIDQGNYWQLLGEDKVEVRVYNSPVKISVYHRGRKVIQEREPLLFSEDKTIQSLDLLSDEQFVGGGMQNGRFSHRNQTINIARDYNWQDGGNPNPTPFYISSRGYGVFRNTFAPGKYNFNHPGTFQHAENQFDGFYFLGDVLQVLDKYTQLTGRPFMPPNYGLQLGDSDCYLKTANGRPPKHTLQDSTKVAQGYVENDMPVGWMLVNDGYGCGYENLRETNLELKNKNISLGLWTEEDLTNQPEEVGDFGVRVRKLDVKWVGPGYEFAFRACHDAYNGIEKYSDARGFVWLVEGWSGVQRCGVQWTGDQTGSFENIRFHIPTLFGSGLSGQAYVAGDIDGIFGGSPETYIRDLQFKMFSPVSMVMSGWAKFDKQPWRYGEPGTTINRKYLKLRQQLLPYIYSLAWQAHTTGIPLVRATLLEFPNDPRVWDDTTKYQYMFGPAFLVAPVYTNSTIRNNIYFPQGKWSDYWSGDIILGPKLLSEYDATLDKLPLFIREGSIIPMFKPNALQLDIYPTSKFPTSFTLYEDDQVTRAYKKGAYSTQNFTLTPQFNGYTITINSIQGYYKNQLSSRPYHLTIHSYEPQSIQLINSTLKVNDLTWTHHHNVINLITPKLSPLDLPLIIQVII